ncbi:hypothetical protein IPP92_02505 [Candidatus Saccharibacteria bacterium]|nr:MAG: hypothetical protein IPP92_02505 [Candidatus Saccharibacteria bacterium]
MTADEVKACPVPDVKQCVTTVGFPTDAVVYADVHTAADSPVDNVITSGPFTVNTQISVSVPTTNYKFTVIRIVAKDGTVLKTQQVTSTTACNTVIPDNPGPRTVIGTVQKGTASCTTHEVEQFRVDTVIPQVWSATAKAYIDDPDKSHWTTVRVDLPSRPMTADEVKACPVPDVKQCVTTVGFPTDAVVYADVHTAADSPVDNVITSGPFTVNTQISVSVPTTNYKFTVIRIVAKDGTVLKTQQVTSTTACNTVIPDNPGPRTVIGTGPEGDGQLHDPRGRAVPGGHGHPAGLECHRQGLHRRPRQEPLDHGPGRLAVASDDGRRGQGVSGGRSPEPGSQDGRRELAEDRGLR